MTMKKTTATALSLVAALTVSSGAPSQVSAQASAVVLRPAQLFDGEVMQQDWAVIVEGERIVAVGPAAEISTPPGADELDLPGMTLLPGLIEGHSHVLLHPYNETPWTEQVLQESLAERTARAVNHLRDTLMLNGDRCPVEENRDRVLSDGDQIYLLAPIAGG